MLDAHPEARIVYEHLSVASMRFKARSMNAYLYASQLGHIPDQLAWAAARRGMAAHTVNPAYSSQECPRCHFVSRGSEDVLLRRVRLPGPCRPQGGPGPGLTVGRSSPGCLQDQRGRQGAAAWATRKLETSTSRSDRSQGRGRWPCSPVERQGLPKDVPGIIF